MRRPAAFMAGRSSTVSGRASAFMGLELRQLSLPEVAVGQLGMGNDKVGLRHAPLAEADDVQVEGARPPVLRPDAPLDALDGLACPEKRPGVQAGLEQHHLIEV